MTTAIDSSYVAAVLKKYNFKKVRRSKTGWTCLCPFHDNTDTAAFSIGDNGLWMCFSCGIKGNMKKLIGLLGGKMTLTEELKLMAMQLNSSKYCIGNKPRTSILPKDFKTYTKDTVSTYIANRLEWNTIQHFGLGASNWDKLRDRCVIPIAFKGKVVGFHGRALLPDMEPRYWNSDACDIKEFLFNYDGCEKGRDLIVTEGAFNAMSLWEKGLPNTVATFGTKFTPKQVQLMFSLAPESITICFDRDSKPIRPGQKATIALGNATHQLVATYVMPLPMDKDPNDLNKDVLLACHANRIPFEKIRG